MTLLVIFYFSMKVNGFPSSIDPSLLRLVLKVGFQALSKKLRTWYSCAFERLSC